MLCSIESASCATAACSSEAMPLSFVKNGLSLGCSSLLSVMARVRRVSICFISEAIVYSFYWLSSSFILVSSVSCFSFSFSVQMSL
mmetsp:Transcript_40880/g.53566  ORF Transcript_40880/g.53566 Transcript_40880/m.53566 type:complete len:86 (+) Transcript_40880:394-651(+)